MVNYRITRREAASRLLFSNNSPRSGVSVEIYGIERGEAVLIENRDNSVKLHTQVWRFTIDKLELSIYQLFGAKNNPTLNSFCAPIKSHNTAAVDSVLDAVCLMRAQTLQSGCRNMKWFRAEGAKMFWGDWWLKNRKHYRITHRSNNSPNDSVSNNYRITRR